jgi:hypothetical protein
VFILNELEVRISPSAAISLQVLIIKELLDGEHGTAGCNARGQAVKKPSQPTRSQYLESIIHDELSKINSDFQKEAGRGGRRLQGEENE